jgi:hypothetical protein
MLQEAEKNLVPKYRREVPSHAQKTMTMQCTDTDFFLALSVSFFLSYSRVDCVCVSVYELIMDSNMVSSSQLIFMKMFIKISRVYATLNDMFKFVRHLVELPSLSAGTPVLFV